MPDNRTPNDRIEGLDLLRVILSFWVIAIHVMHYGGLRTNSDPSGLGYYLLWFWAISMYSVINCFALVSGFVLYDQTLKYTRILRLFLTVAYHGIVITLLFRLFYPHAVTDRHWLWAFFPVSQVVSLPAVLQVIAVFIIASLIWLICFGLDLIRQRIFLLLRIDHLLDKLDAKLVAWHADT